MKTNRSSLPIFSAARRIALLAVSAVFASAIPASACAVCFGAKDSNTTQSVAIAIWFLMGAVGCVLGGVALFAVHLWRCENRPLSPDEELAEEVSQLTEAYD